jgi:VCBS repeat-containing protein
VNGTLTLNPDGSFTYTPDENFNGTDTFTYKANDGTADSGVATVTITVDPQNDAPVATDDSYSVAEDGKLTVAPAGVLTNDTDIDGDTLSAVLVSGPENGTLTLNADGSFTYTPDEDFNGTDGFTYIANDGSADSGIATVTITVDPQNDAPVATDDGYTVDEDGTLSVAAAGVLVNDTDIDGDTLSAVLVSGPENGTLTFNPDGSFTYTPGADFNGIDSFTYKANDGTADGNVATVTITVDPQNDAPVAQADTYTIAEDGKLTVAAAGVLANDTDVDGDTLTAALVDGPDHGKLVLSPDGSFVYTPDANFNGTDSFTYQASDGTAASEPVTVTLNVTPVNDPPVAEDDSYDLGQGGSLVVPARAGVLANDTDIDGGPLTVTVASGPAHGELSLNADGSFTYTPDPNYDGIDSFTYTVSDGLGGTDTATVTMNIADAAPTATDDVVQTADAARQTIDLVIILDRSGSMENSPGVPGFSTRLELARAAIAALFEAYGSVADLNILIVDFASDAANSGWLDTPEEANAYLASLVAGGGTNYTAAIQEAIAAYQDAPLTEETKTEIYFLSDGVPTSGTSLAATGTVGTWESFLSDPANQIESAFAVGIGTGIEAGDPDLADVAFPNGDPDNPTVVTDESQLIDTLVDTVANPVSGNVLLNDDFGPDGKGNGGVGLLTITVDGVKYTYGGNQITNDGDLPVIAGATLVVLTGLGGTLEFHFDNGDFTYTPPDVDDPQTELFDYTIVDGDGSEIGATLQIDISDSGVVVLDPHTVIGTDGADSLAGAAGAVDDIISGGKGADSLVGGEGNDHVQGGADGDSLSGGAGIDILIGGTGNDTLDGGAGADVLVGGEGADRILVGTGDRADGGGGNDTILLLDTTGFDAVQGGDAGAVNLGSAGGDVLVFNGGLDLTALANDRILGIETISMLDSIGGAGGDTLTLGAGDVIDIGAGQFDPNGNLPAAPAIRVDGDQGDVLNLEGGGWQQVQADKLPSGYTLYLHDSPAAGVTPDTYVLVQTAVTVTTD